MFENCTSLKKLNLSNFDTSNAKNFAYMFECCTSMELLDISHFSINRNFINKHFINMCAMFAGCTSLKTVKASDPKLIKRIRNDYTQIQIEYQLRE